MQDEPETETIADGDVGATPELALDDDKPAAEPEEAEPAAEPEETQPAAEPEEAEPAAEPEEAEPAAEPAAEPEEAEPAAEPAGPEPAAEPPAEPPEDPDVGKNQPAKEGPAVYDDDPAETAAIKGAAQAALDRAEGKVMPDRVAAPSEPPADIQSVGIVTGQMVQMKIDDTIYSLDLGHPLLPAPALIWALLAWTPEAVEGFFADLRIQRARGLIEPLEVTIDDPAPVA